MPIHTVQPRFALIAGPNGAGKTTFAKQMLLRSDAQYTYLNADDIARESELAALPRERRDLVAAERLLERLDELIAEARDVAVETTLSGRIYMRRLNMLRVAGYWTELYYFRLPSVELALDRIRQRVAAGGHDIPEAVVRRRFAKSGEMLRVHYAGLVDHLEVRDWQDNGWRLTEVRRRA